MLWYRINGGEPEHCINERGDHGDEVNPPCPVLTPNQWYGREGWLNRTSMYSFWPPYVRASEHYGRRWQSGKPVCLIHNVNGWGYRDLVEPVRKLGVRVFGAGSPDGLVRHGDVKHLLSYATAYVHLKSNDAPGYALYEALTSKCPIILPRRLIWRCRMQDLFVEGKTCLCFDRETHDPLTPEEVLSCTAEIQAHLSHLDDPDFNKCLGEAGYNRLQEVMWREDRDLDSLKAFLERNFP